MAQMAQMAQLVPPRTSLSPILSPSVAPWNHSNHAVLQKKKKQQQKQRAERLKVCFVRASVGEGGRDGRREQAQASFPPPGELQYFGKLSASCVAGAFLVKYGSLCVPTVTTPDLNVALVMISAPCLVSVVLLAFASVFFNENARKQ